MGITLAERMADVGGGDTMLRQQVDLEGKDAQHVIDAALDLLDPLRPPGPDGRADEMRGLDARGLEVALQIQIEVRRIDADEDIGPVLQQARLELRRGCRRSRGSGAAPRRSRAPRACRCGHQAVKPRRIICGPPMPSGLHVRANASSDRRAAVRPADHRRFPRQPHGYAGRIHGRRLADDAALRRRAGHRKSSIISTSGAASG